jgi:diguanylate cyclase (GGDEF)-like protein/PAS domain S-box-containing protein
MAGNKINKSEEAIIAANKDWDALFNTITDSITVHDRDFNIIRMNQSALEMLGLQHQKQVSSTKCFRYYHGSDEPPADCASCQTLKTGKPSTTEIFEPFLNKHLEIRALPRFGGDGQLVGLIHIVRDISERRSAEAMLQERIKELNCLYGISALVELPGISLDEILKNTAMLIPAAWQFPEIAEASIVLEGKTFPTAQFRETSWMQACDVLVNGKPVGKVTVCYLEEPQTTDEAPFLKEERQLLNAIAERLGHITERMRTEEALRGSENRYRELSILDGLTQLCNSRHFYHQLKMEIDRANRYRQPLTLLLLDIDNFKAFNDTYGHVEGDQVLQRLGQVFKRCLRQTDSAYRYGGEEFAVLMPTTTNDEGFVTAERIRKECKKENFSPAPAKDVRLTVSIGLAQYQPREDIKDFVHRVDQRMYKAKSYGKDRVCSES